MRKLLAALICFILLITAGFAAVAEDADAALAWVNANLPYERDPEPIEIVPYDELPPVVEGQHHYLLLCVDVWNAKKRPDNAKITYNGNGSIKNDYGLTDGIVLVTLDTRAHRIMLTSFMREQLVQRPDGHIGRINYIYTAYGAEALCRTISEHIGVRIEKYILFDFKQVENIVDYLGGVDIYLNRSEINYLHRYRVPVRTVVSLDGKHDIYYNGNHPEGVYHISSRSSVYYMRIRKAGGGGDFMRTQRVRNVLSSLADKCREISWEDAQGLANNIMDNSTSTNLNLEEITEAAGFAFGLRDSTIEELRIPTDNAVRRILYAKMTTEEVNWPVCREVMANYLQNSFLVMDEEDDEDW